MEAAIGIEPMDKGFAVQNEGMSPSITECHGQAESRFSEDLRKRETLCGGVESPQKSPHSIFGDSPSAVVLGEFEMLRELLAFTSLLLLIHRFRIASSPPR